MLTQNGFEKFFPGTFGAVKRGTVLLTREALETGLDLEFYQHIKRLVSARESILAQFDAGCPFLFPKES